MDSITPDRYRLIGWISMLISEKPPIIVSHSTPESTTPFCEPVAVAPVVALVANKKTLTGDVRWAN
jgi:hypothetical protein